MGESLYALMNATENGRGRLKKGKEMGKKQETTFDLIGYLPIGHENAKTFEELHLPIERMTMRTAVAETNEHGEHFVGNMQDGNGYFLFDLPKELELMETYIKQESARAYSILSRIRKMSGVARRLRFGADLKARRLENGLTQGELSVRCDIPKKRLSILENEKDIPTKEEITALKKVLK